MKKSKDKLIFGRKPVLEAIRDFHPINKVFIANKLRGEFEKEIRHLSKEYGVPLQYVDPGKLNKLVNSQNHQGVVAFISPIPFYRVGQVVAQVFELGKQPLLVVLDGITDVRNFGAIARSAEVLGAHALVIGMKNAAPVNDVALKTSAGALLNIPVCRCASIHRQLAELKNYGILIMGSEANAKVPITGCDLTQPIAIVLGSEESGIQKSVMDQLDVLFQIPQIGKIESLNVSVAAGIVLYEASRQRAASAHQ